MPTSVKILTVSLSVVAVQTSFAARAHDVPTVEACSTSVKCTTQQECNRLGGNCGCIPNPVGGPHCISTVEEEQ